MEDRGRKGKEEEMGDKKGKAKMSREELEEEELREAKLKYMEKLRKKYVGTKFSKQIQRISPTGGLGDFSRFSWRYPAFFGFRGWDLGGCSNDPLRPSQQTIRSGRYWPQDVTPRSNPLPEPTFQGHTPYCFPHSIYHLLMIQLAIVSKIKRVPCPIISLSHLIDVAASLEPFRTPANFIAALKKNGIYQQCDYNGLTHKPKVDKPSISVASVSSFTGERLSCQEFGLAICRAIVEAGGVIIVTRSYDRNGQRLVRQVRIAEGENSDTKTMNVNHALCCFEWEQRVDGTFGFVCIDSGTGGFHIQWLDDINSIVLVYVVQLKLVDSVRKALMHK